MRRRVVRARLVLFTAATMVTASTAGSTLPSTAAASPRDFVSNKVGVTVNGASATVYLLDARQPGWISFHALAGQTVTAHIGRSLDAEPCSIMASIVELRDGASGAPLFGPVCAEALDGWTTTITESAPYRIVLVPQRDTSGALRVSVTSPSPVRSITPGATYLSAALAQGEEGRFGFWGQAGQTITGEAAARAHLESPSGTVFATAAEGSAELPASVVPETGVSWLVVPAADTPSVLRLRLDYVRDQIGTVTVGGHAPVNLGVPGRNGIYTLQAAPGLVLHVFVSGYASVGSAMLLAMSPAGEEVASTDDINEGFSPLVIDQGGTWKIMVDPQGGATVQGELVAVPATIDGPEIRAGGPSVSVMVRAQGQAVALPFTGMRGEVVSAVATYEPGRYGDLGFRLERPDGSRVDERPEYRTGGLFLAPITLDAGGTWRLLVGVNGEVGATASVRLYDVHDIVQAVRADGVTHRATTTSPGQQIRWQLQATAGQTVYLATTVDFYASVSLVSPSGASMSAGGVSILDSPGTWTVVVSSDDGDVGTASLAVVDLLAPSDAIVANGPPVAVRTADAMDVTRFHFTAAAGDRVILDLSGASFDYELLLLDGDGTMVGSSYDSPIDMVLWSASRARVVAVVSHGPGEALLRLHTAPEAVRPISVGGAPVPLTVVEGGGAARFTFAGSVGEKVSASWEAGTFADLSSLNATLLRPDLAQVAWSSSGWLDGFELDTAGTWSLRFDPVGSAAGSTVVRLHDATDVEGAVQPGGPAAHVELAPGQQALLRFEGAADSVAAAQASGGTVAPEALAMSLLDPSGAAVSWGQGSVEAHLDRAGTWTLAVRCEAPVACVADLTVVDPVPLRAEVTVGGPAVPVSLQAHQEAVFAFTAVAGQVIAATVDVAPAGATDVSIFGPAGYVTWGSSDSGSVWIDQTELPVAGDYSLRVQPHSGLPVQVTVTVLDAEDEITKITPSSEDRTVTVTKPGARARLEFDATEGQTVSVTWRSSTSPSSWVRVKDPYGQDVRYLWDPGTATIAIDVSGTWSVIFDPPGTELASAVLRIVEATTVTTPIELDGDAVAVRITDGLPQRFSVVLAAGDDVVVRVHQGTLPSSSWQLLSPDGVAQAWWDLSGGGDADTAVRTVATPATAGTWLIAIDPSDAGASGTGSLEVQRASDPTVAAAQGGPEVQVRVATEERAAVTFDATGQDDLAALVRLDGALAPDGVDAWFQSALGVRVDASVAGGWTTGVLMRPTSLLDAGSWRFVVRPYWAWAGVVRVRLLTVDRWHGDLTVDGPPVQLDLAAGTAARISFTATEGQPITAIVESSDLTDTTAVELRGSYGWWRGTGEVGSGGATITVRADSTGTWQLIVDNATKPFKGKAWVVTSPVDVLAPVTVGGPTAKVAIPEIGQAARAEFYEDGTFAKHEVIVSDVSLHGGCAAVTLWAPDHRYPWNSLGTVCDGQTARRLGRFSRAGTWSVRIDPIGLATGTLAVTVT